MQQLIYLALKGLMNGYARLGLMRFSRVFHNICGKVWDPVDLPTLREDVATTFSILERDLLEAFFNVMMHMTLHVVEKLDICGPIHSRWMYPIKRAFKTFKRHVHNRAKRKHPWQKVTFVMRRLGL
jgi:hypothetical protein